MWSLLDIGVSFLDVSGHKLRQSAALKLIGRVDFGGEAVEF